MKSKLSTSRLPTAVIYGTASAVCAHYRTFLDRS